MKKRQSSPPPRPNPHSKRTASAKKKPVTIERKTAFEFPAAWLWLVDEVAPQYVKRVHSPRPAWRDRPFTTEDVQFFFKGIAELSDRFTDERTEKALSDYFQHPRFRSGYLLYFLPLQAAKFLGLYSVHSEAIESAWKAAKKSGVFRFLDLGAGPGTASFAFLIHLQGRLSRMSVEERDVLPPIEFHWWDLQNGIMEEGEALLHEFAAQFPSLRGRMKVVRRVESWWEAARNAPEGSLAVFGNLLNESHRPSHRTAHRARASDLGEEVAPVSLAPAAEAISKILKKLSPGGGGALFVEPADRRSSQRLSQLRDDLLSISDESEKPGLPIWGPCLHAGRCPMAVGRDWCHFSMPVEIPGKWFKAFSRKLGSERQWLKFSYLWWASPNARAPQPEPQLRRVISDPLREGTGKSQSTTILLCEPERPLRLPIPGARRLLRGEIADLQSFSAPRPPAWKPERFRSEAQKAQGELSSERKPKSRFQVKRRT